MSGAGVIAAVAGRETVKWRGTCPADLTTGFLVISFDREDGSVLRLEIDAESSKGLAETLAFYAQEVPSDGR